MCMNVLANEIFTIFNNSFAFILKGLVGTNEFLLKNILCSSSINTLFQPTCIMIIQNYENIV